MLLHFAVEAVFILTLAREHMIGSERGVAIIACSARGLSLWKRLVP